MANIPLVIFYFAIVILSTLSFIYYFNQSAKLFLVKLELLVLAGSAIYYAYSAVKNIMGNASNSSTVINGWFRYTLNFAFSAKFLFCLINCTTIMFIYTQMITKWTIFDYSSTELTLVMIYTYFILPIANFIMMLKFAGRIISTTKSDVTAIFILVLVWFVYMLLMTIINLNLKFSLAIQTTFAYTFLNMFLAISGLPLYDYFFLDVTNKERILV